MPQRLDVSGNQPKHDFLVNNQHTITCQLPTPTNRKPTCIINNSLRNMQLSPTPKLSEWSRTSIVVLMERVKIVRATVAIMIKTNTEISVRFKRTPNHMDSNVAFRKLTDMPPLAEATNQTNLTCCINGDSENVGPTVKSCLPGLLNKTHRSSPSLY